MQKTPAAWAALAVFLGIVSGVLWGKLRTERQLVSQLREQMALMQAKLSEPPPAPRIAVEPGAPPVAANVPGPAPSPMPIPTPMPPAAPPVRAVPPPIGDITVPVSAEELRNIVIGEADEAATGRARLWSDGLSQAGLQLTTAQFQALTAASISEHRRDAEETLALQRNATPPRDAEEAFRIREENLVRSNENNLRILKMARPQLTEAQAEALRKQFEKGHATRMANLRAERERAQQTGQPPR
jgi:hypothetical protein